MDECIIAFDKLCREVDIGHNKCVADISNISLKHRQNSVFCYFCDVSGQYQDEIYYEISKNENGIYDIFKIDRGHYHLYKSSSAVIGSIALFIYVIRFEPYRTNRTEAELNAIEKTKQEIIHGNIDSAKHIIHDSVGNDFVTFDKNEVNKISVISVSENKIDIHYNNRSILGQHHNKLNIRNGYSLALNSCYNLISFRKILNNIIKIFPNIDEKDKEGLEYLYLVCK